MPTPIISPLGNFNQYVNPLQISFFFFQTKYAANVEIIGNIDHEDIDQNNKRPGWINKFRTSMKQGGTGILPLIRSPFKTNSSTVNCSSGTNGQSQTANKNPPAAISVNESRRKKEDNMAIIFTGFILVFLVCHLPRLLLNIHELITIQDAMMCMRAHKQPFPIWSLVMIR